MSRSYKKTEDVKEELVDLRWRMKPPAPQENKATRNQ